MSREILTKKWKDWVDYWAVDFDFESKKEIIRVRIDSPVVGSDFEAPPSMNFEEVWTGDYIFENEWQCFRTRNDRNLDLTTAWKEVTLGRRYKIAVKVVDIFGNDTMKIVEAGL
ncbi:MAG: DNA methyltransferase [Fibrobacterota bacterium]|nr:DNA methyltransferase [Fibrobacterota bacterium]